MSLRLAASRIIQNGRILLRNFKPYKKSGDVVDSVNHSILPRGARLEASPRPITRASAVRNVGFQFHLHARRLLVDNILNRVTNSLSSDLRKKATKRLFYGDSAPFFALVGVSLASGTGLLTKDEELEGLCWEIQEAVSKLQWNTKLDIENNEFSESSDVGLKNFVIGPAIAKGCSAVVYGARKRSAEGEANMTTEAANDSTTFPLAIKMMFNYDAESNATSILKAMFRETVPAKWRFSNEEVQIWERSFADRNRSLPSHPNIVQMDCVFADRIPDIPGSLALYPDALPPRINPQGYGRNMSLFLVMKRYDCSLQQYLKDTELTPRTATILLCQLLEAVTHMTRHGVAHRDLKSDNILLDLSEGESCPLLVVTDFGCCLADRIQGLRLPYHTPDTDKGGNAALMAPEVACAEAGPFTSINYSKSDAWAVGAIAYELFGLANPFYPSAGNKKPLLRNISYADEDLPTLPETVPSIISDVVAALLHRNPSKRLSAEAAANICQLFLWAPSTWLRVVGADVPTTNEVLQWILCLTTKVLGEGRKYNKPATQSQSSTDFSLDENKVGDTGINMVFSGRRTLPEYQLISSFLARVKLRQVKEALQWIHSGYM